MCCGGGRGGLIPEENVEEINLNYKDEASLESGSGRATEVKEGGGNSHYFSPLLYIGRRHYPLLLTLLPPSLYPVGMRWPVILPLLACHPDTPPRLDSRTGLSPISQRRNPCCPGPGNGSHSVPPLLPALLVLTDSRCLGFSGNMRPSLPASQTPPETKYKLLSPRTCDIPENSYS